MTAKRSMREEMRKTAAIVLSLFMTAGTALADTPKDGDPQPAQTAKKKSTKPAKSATAALAEQVEALRRSLEAQEQQIKRLQEELARRDAEIGDAKSAAAADAKASEASAKVAAVASSTAEVKTTTTALSSDVADLKLSNDAVKGATIHYKGISITHGGFLAAETVYRTRATSADINTPFTGIPYSAANLAHVGENNFTARQSRLSLLAAGKLAQSAPKPTTT
jgi:hypothetical protein